MANDRQSSDKLDLTQAVAAPVVESTAESVDGPTRELWRVVSVDGSTQVFQTRPGSESGGKRGARRVTACALDSEASALFDRNPSPLPTLISEAAPLAATAPADELSLELTSVTQAWPSLSPGIRGAVMALIRAASTARSTRPAAAPRRE